MSLLLSFSTRTQLLSQDELHGALSRVSFEGLLINWGEAHWMQWKGESLKTLPSRSLTVLLAFHKRRCLRSSFLSLLIEGGYFFHVEVVTSAASLFVII
jgi:hypothetical protein